MQSGGKKKYTLTLAMIAKNEAKNLPTLWQSVKRIVDEWVIVDTGSTDDTVSVAKSLGANVIEVGDRFVTRLTEEHVAFFSRYGIEAKVGDSIFEFGKAREFSFAQAAKDFILWLDGDDILCGSEKLQEIIDANLDTQKQLGIHLQYNYDLDEYKNPIVTHYRERVVPNNGTFHWQGRIHEIIVPTIETQYIRVDADDCYVLHNSDGKRKESSSQRNTKALLLDLFEQGDKPDPRTLFFLAEALKLEKKFDIARDLYEQYLTLSGWDEERCLAAVRLCNYYLVRSDYSKALEWAYRAIKERPDFPVGYSAAAQSYYGLAEYDNAIRFAKLAIDTEQPDTLVMVDQKYNQFIPLYLIAEIFLKQGQMREALSMTKEAMKFEPLNEMLLRIQYSCERMMLEDEIVKSFAKTIEFLKDQGELEKASKVLRSVPISLENDIRVLELQKGVRDEMEKRSQSWISETKRLNEKSEVDPQYHLLVNDLKKFCCKDVLLVSNEPLLAAYLKHYGFHVKRVVKFDEVAQSYDAVFFDYNLHLIQNRSEFYEQGRKLAEKYIGLCVPNRDPNAIIACAPDHVEVWLGESARVWNVMPLQNGVIYGSATIRQPQKAHKITFFCGASSIEEWGPLSHIDGGVGGSEEAVIYLSRELAIKGHEVEVVNSFPHPCTVEGVKWRHASTIKPDEEFDTLILWRIPHYLDEFELKGKQVFLWLHDVPETHWFTKDRLEKISKIICLSKYHRSLLPDLPDDKFILSQNGVDLSQFNQEVERNPKKVIYTSSYDRGAEHLLRIWNEVRSEVPDAELHIFYGWGSYDKLRTEPKQREWKSWMIEQFKQPGVFEHGRIGQDVLAKELLASSVYAYPCHFEEISCISAMKSQAAGCIPLTTDYAALAETNLTKYKISGNGKENEEAFKNELIRILKSDVAEDEREAIAKRAWEEFSWTKVAKQWSRFIEEDSNVRSNS